ncbi:MAG: NAD(P)/FAD-dependent oxidoreductase [Anaerolineaceae bacterium]|nr:NAD(P)/FAD-dependent oxidoreductase [Anaerolineaceae bacterium]
MKEISIIGAGVAGLTAAVYARKSGFDVDVYEMHTLPGGECTGWQRGDYHFDGCIHWMMGTKPGSGLHQVWRDVGALDDSIAIHLNEIFFEYQKDGRTLKIYRDADRLEKHLLDLSPIDAHKIHELCKDIRAFAKMDMPVSKPMEMYTALDGIKMAFKFGKLMPLFKKYNSISVIDLAEQFQDPLLREGFINLIPGPYVATSILSTLGSLHNNDSGWPMGGSLALSKRMAAYAEKLGVRIHYHAPVEKILVENGSAVGLRLKTGEEVCSEYVLSAADGHHTLYDLLDGQYVDDLQQKMYSDHETYQLDCCSLVFLGVNADLSARAHTVYIPLDEPIMVADKAQECIMIKHFCYDPAMAKAGKSTVCVMLMGSYDWWQEKHQDKVAYKQAKQQLAKEVQAAVEKIYPEITGTVEEVDVATPMTYVRYCNAFRGAYMSFVTQPGMQPTSLNGKLEGLQKFYMGGMWTQFPGGLPGAAMGGRYAIQRICKEAGKKFQE